MCYGKSRIMCSRQTRLAIKSPRTIGRVKHSKGRGHTLLATVVMLTMLVSCAGEAAAMTDDAARPGRVIYNLDCTQFFVGSFGPVVPETIDKFVDTHAALGITDLFINVNGQRTNYRSDVWEAWWDGYDPNLGVDQPFFAGIDPKRRMGPDANDAQMYMNMLALHEQGCDYAKRMIDRARHNKVKAWISLRMNDGHSGDKPDHPSHNALWRSHPQWRLAYGLDYEQPEVRGYYMKLIREVCTRYDLDGLELDFLRFWLYFREGRQHEGVKLMTVFLKDARQATQAAAKRLGHPVELAVRVPSTPWIARRHGLDAAAWAKAGLVDLIIASPFWFSANSDIPVETWKGLLIGKDVEIAVSLEDALNSGASGRRTMTHEEMRGILVSAWHRGADGAYFFNLFTGPLQYWPRQDHDRLLKDAGSYEALCAGPRRHALTITRPWAAGEPGASQLLPYTGKHGAFRLHIGPAPLPTSHTRIELKIADTDQPPEVRLNGIACKRSGLVDPEHIRKAGSQPPEQGQRHAYNVPSDAISDGYNLIEVRAEQKVTITWVEISILP